MRRSRIPHAPSVRGDGTVSTKWNHKWNGIDPATKAFCDEMVSKGLLHHRRKAAIREWLSGCARAGLSTMLDADLTGPAFTAHLENQLKAAGQSALPGAPGSSQITWLRMGLTIYDLAIAQGLRQRPAPALAAPTPRRWSVTIPEARAALPQSDQAEIAAIEAIFNALAVRQWRGLGLGVRRHATGLKHKGTLSVGVVTMTINAVGGFLQYAYLQGWKPFTLRDLLTPERLTRYFYYASRPDGQGIARSTALRRESQILDFFRRGREARPTPVTVLSAADDAAIRVKMAEEHEHEDQWCLTPPNLSNTGAYKWFPNLDQVRLAVVSLHEQIDRAEERYARGGLNARGRWLAVRDATLALCTLMCMWRADTAATGSLLHLRRDPVTGLVVNGEGFMVMENIARAKNTNGAWYPFVPELTIPRNVVPYIQRLLAIEGRSLEKPLCDGEQPVHLSAANGDTWGHDRIMAGELVVAPIFRVHANRPEGLDYGTIKLILKKELTRLHYAATNPHTLRAAGAIYWSFIQGMPEELVMSLGLWEDPKTLRKSYARINADDRRELMNTYIPLMPGAQPTATAGLREKAASDALSVLGQFLAKPTNPWEARRLLRDLRRNYERIDQSIAADLGVVWEPITPNPFRAGEVERVDAACRGAGYDRGLSSVLGRDVLADEALATLAQGETQSSTIPLGLRRARAETDSGGIRYALPPSSVRPPATHWPRKSRKKTAASPAPSAEDSGARDNVNREVA